MASAIFAAPLGAAGPAIEMAQVQYTEDGVLRGGYACIGQVPQAETCLVRVWASEAQIDALAADGRYLFVEEVADGEETGG